MSKLMIRSAILAKSAKSDEKLMVRLILREITNPRPYIKEGRNNRDFVFEFDRELNAHVLDVPLSVWQDSNPNSNARANGSLVWDILGKPQNNHQPILPIILPWPGAESDKAVSVDSGANDELLELKTVKLPIISELLEKLNAPDEVVEALSIVTGGTASDLRKFVDGIHAEESALNISNVPDEELKGPDPKPTEKPKGKGGRTSRFTPEELAERKRKQAAARMQKKRERKRAEAGALA